MIKSLLEKLEVDPDTLAKVEFNGKSYVVVEKLNERSDLLFPYPVRKDTPLAWFTDGRVAHTRQ